MGHVSRSARKPSAAITPHNGAKNGGAALDMELLEGGVAQLSHPFEHILTELVEHLLVQIDWRNQRRR